MLGIVILKSNVFAAKVTDSLGTLKNRLAFSVCFFIFIHKYGNCNNMDNNKSYLSNQLTQCAPFANTANESTNLITFS